MTPEFFDVLRIAPLIGRAFTNEDVTSESFHLAVISHELWQTQFNGATDILARQVVLEGETFLVLGVMPRGFDTPEASEVWVPSRWGNQALRGRLISPVVVGRMAVGVTAAQALDEIANTTFSRNKTAARAWSPQITSFRHTLIGDMGRVILLLAAGALIVLLVASTNIASLLLTRVSARQREFAVRRALGASARDIDKQILAETLLLSAMALIAAIPISMWTLDAIRVWVPIQMHGAANIALDGRSLAAAAIFSILTAALFNAAPLWSARRGSPLTALRGAPAATVDPGWRRFRSGLTVAQIAFALVLLAGAVTVIRTVSTLLALDLGVRGDRVLVVGLDLPHPALQAQQRLPTFERYAEAFRALPGIESVAVTTAVPGAAPFGQAELLLEDEPVPPKAGYVGTEIIASPEYFSIMGIDLLAGRAFAASDHFYALKVAMVSESFARRYGLRPVDVVGRRAVLDHRWVQIVGVVRDLRLGGPLATLDATVYVPYAQRLVDGPMQIVIKSRGDPSQLVASVRAAGASVDPSAPLYDIRTFDQIREAHVRDRRFVMTMLSWFGGLAFVLAVLGLYAVVGYMVHLRTQEIGIRMAMGATRGAVRMSVVANSLAHCLAGIVVGAAIAIAMSWALSSRLRDLGELDAATLSIVSAGFLASAMLAAWLPARRATQIDPVQALRAD